MGSVSSLVLEKKIFEISKHIIGPDSHVEYPTGTKNRNFVEDHPRNLLSLVPIGPVVSEKKLEM